MLIKNVTITRNSISKDSCFTQDFKYKDAVVNNKQNPTSDNIIINLSLVLLDMFLEMQSEQTEKV